MNIRPLALSLAAAMLAGAAPTAAAGAPYVPGEVIVRFKGERAGRELRLPAGVGVGPAARALRSNPRVSYATANYIAHASAQPFFPNDPGKAGVPGGWQQQQWNFLSGAGINAPQAWGNLIERGRPGGRGVKVAVLDTGVAYKTAGRYRISPDLRAGQFVRGYDFVAKDPRPFDENGHGTHVASTIGERVNNGLGLTGIAYGVRLMPLRVLDSNGAGDAFDIARALRYAARNGAQVINMSLEFDSSVTAAQIPEIVSAVRYAGGRDSLVVAASGNEGISRVAYPARVRRVLSVGGTTEHLCQADYSNEGRGLDLVAPGGGHDSLSPSEPNCRPFEEGGRDVFQLTFTDTGKVRNFGYPDSYQGTSMAAPHVSGTAALIIASGVIGRRPTPAAIERRLKQTARDLGEPGYDRRYGCGAIDAAIATTPGPPPTPNGC